MKRETFQNTASRYAEIISRRDRIRVEFAGAKASVLVEEGHIRLPSLPQDLLLSDAERKIYGGFLDHEVAHLRWTTKNPKEIKDQNLFKIFNLLEDIRIEQQMIKQYPGSEGYINAMCDYWFEKTTKPPDSQADFACKAVVRELYKKVRNYDMTKLFRGSLDELPESGELQAFIDGYPVEPTEEQTFEQAKEFLRLLKKWLKEPPKQDNKSKKGVPSSEGGTEGSEQGKGEEGQDDESSIVLGVGDPDEQEEGGADAATPDAPSDETGDTDDVGADKEAEGDEPGDKKEDPENDTNPDDEGEKKDEKEDVEPGSSDDADGDAEDDLDEDEEAEQERDSRSGEGDLEEEDSAVAEGSEDDVENDDGDGKEQEPTGKSDKEIEEEISDAFDELEEMASKREGLKEFLGSMEPTKEEQQSQVPSLKGKKWFPPFNIAADRVKKWEDAKTPNQRHDAYRLLESLKGEASALAKAIRIQMRSRAKKAWDRELEDGRVDPKRLYRLRVEDKKVFRKKREVEAVNTAVCLAVDWSGSMDAYHTKKAMLLVSEALGGQPNVKLDIRTWTCKRQWSDSSDKSKYGRLESLQIWILKEFDELYVKAKDRIAAFDGGRLQTPMADAVLNAFETLLPRREKKRIIWMVTDGTPYYATGNENHSDFLLLERVLNKCDQYGIDVWMSTLGNESHKELLIFKDRFKVMKKVDPDNMGTSMLEMLKEIK